MAIKISIDGVSNREEALAAVAALESAFGLTSWQLSLSTDKAIDATTEMLQSLGEALRNQPGQICTDPNAAAAFETGGYLNEDELAADAADRDFASETVVAIDPATLGFGGAQTSAAPPPPPPPATDSVGVPLDSDGLPHDPRIHASTKTKIKSGQWKRKPNVTDEDYARVTEELRGIMALPNVRINVSPLSGAQIITNFPPPPLTDVAAQAPPPPPSAVTPPPPPPAATQSTGFPEFVTWLTGHIREGKLSQLQASEAARAAGLVNAEGKGQVSLLQQRPDLIPAVKASLELIIAGAA